VSVADTGRGIPRDRLAELFTPFQRLGAEQTQVEGTGLGLALTKGLVEAMGGAVLVETAPGRGSTFILDLPRAADPLSAAEAAETAEMAPPSKGVAKQVLYIEDNFSNLRLVERILGRWPEITLLPAMEGGLGLDLAREHRPDLILLDLNLPDMPGQEFLERLRGEPETATIPVAVISADATPNQVDRLKHAGARAYLTKPLDLKEFLKMLKETLAA
jgi:CheY-like chemotaxis protein